MIKTARCKYCGGRFKPPSYAAHIVFPDVLETCFSCRCLREQINVFSEAIVYQRGYAKESVKYWVLKLQQAIELNN